jgi:hypothetical protein
MRASLAVLTLLLVMMVASCGIDIQHVYFVHHAEIKDVGVIFPLRLHTG